MSQHLRPIITADIIVVRNITGPEILLIKRGKEPFKDFWALVGGHFDINDDPNIQHAAKRELLEETTILAQVEQLRFVGYYDKPNRDPRGRYVTFVFEFVVEDKYQTHQAGDDAADAQWFALDNLPELAFDHAEILHDYIIQGSTPIVLT